MAIETVRIGYTRLFEVRLLHHYWLDDGATVFDAIADEAKTKRLLTYDVRRLVTVEPSAATVAAIKGLRGVFRMTGLGFLVAVPDDTVVLLDTTFEFFVTRTAPDYANYTALSLRPQPIVDVTDPADTDVVHRYKANVPVLTNLTGASQGTGTDKRLFLSQPYVNGADAGDGVEALVTSGTNLRQLTGDPTGTRPPPRSRCSGRSPTTRCTSTRATSHRSPRRRARPARCPVGSSWPSTRPPPSPP